MFPGEVIYVPQLSLRKITDQSRSVTLLLISVARSVLQDTEFKIYSLWQVFGYIKKKHINCVSYILDPAPAFQLHRSHLLYFVDHKAWDSTYADILSRKPKKSSIICRNLLCLTDCHMV